MTYLCTRKSDKEPPLMRPVGLEAVALGSGRKRKRAWKIYRGMEQLVARRAHNPKARGSSPLPATKKPISADVAQSAERILGKDKVTGSIPVISSIIKYHNMAA